MFSARQTLPFAATNITCLTKPKFRISPLARSLISPLGIATIIAGGVFIYVGYENNSISNSAIGWVLVIFGALLTMFGLQQYVTNFMNPPRDPEVVHGPTEVRLLIQCMGTMARADGAIDLREIDIIEEIHARMLGIAINSDDVREILSELGPDFDIFRKLRESQSQISPLMKRKIVQACHLVMASDLKIRQAEVNKIDEIGSAVGFSKEEVKQITAIAEI